MCLSGMGGNDYLSDALGGTVAVRILEEDVEVDHRLVALVVHVSDEANALELDAVVDGPAKVDVEHAEAAGGAVPVCQELGEKGFAHLPGHDWPGEAKGAGSVGVGKTTSEAGGHVGTVLSVRP